MNFFRTVTAAIHDMTRHGFDSQQRLEYWVDRLRKAAVASMVPDHVLNATLQRTLKTIYDRLVTKRGILTRHPGVGQFTLDKLKPTLHSELQRRIMASAQLIKLNRQSSIEKTLQRFVGWGVSLPAGGTRAADKPEVKDDVRKALSQLPYEERRVAIDQGLKFTTALNDIIAKDQGALAAVWHSHWKEAGYDFRPQHKARDGQVYLIRQSWAVDKGLAKPGDAGYLDEITQPGEEVYCRCYATYIYNLSDLPRAMLTQKGVDALAQARQVMRS